MRKKHSGVLDAIFEEPVRANIAWRDAESLLRNLGAEVMKYKGYSAIVEFDDESGVLFGRVIGLRDVVTFHGTSVSEVTQAFGDSVDDYLEFCAERGESPDKPYSGHFVVRVSPQLHRTMAQAAEKQGVSLNTLVEDSLERVFADQDVVEAGRGLLRRPSQIERQRTKAAEASKAAKNRKRR